MQALFCSCAWSIGIERNNLAFSEFPGYIWMFGGEFGYVLQVHWYPPSIMGVIQCVEQGISSVRASTYIINDPCLTERTYTRTNSSSSSTVAQ